MNKFICLALLLFTSPLYAQMGSVFSDTPSRRIFQDIQLNEEEKMSLLATLLEGDSVQFVMTEDEYDTIYYPLDTAGLHYIDVNKDGLFDLLYSGQSGWNGLSDTKFYVFDKESEQLKFVSTLQGYIFSIEKMDDHITIYTYWNPCCDSYTSQVSIYQIDSSLKITRETISVIGRIRIAGIMDFSLFNTLLLENPTLVANYQDFQSTSPYFGDRNEEIRLLIREKKIIPLLTLKGNIEAKLLDEKELDGVKYLLIITETLNDLPKSLYEWSNGNGRRFVGWVKANN